MGAASQGREPAIALLAHPSGGSAGSPADQGDHQSRRRRNAHSLLSRCKTFSYGQAIQARQEAERSGVDDALLRNTEGDSAAARSPICWFSGRALADTPLSSGCLPGVIRQRDWSSAASRKQHWASAATRRSGCAGEQPELPADPKPRRAATVTERRRTCAVANTQPWLGTISTLFRNQITPISCQPGIRR